MRHKVLLAIYVVIVFFIGTAFLATVFLLRDIEPPQLATRRENIDAQLDQRKSYVDKVDQLDQSITASMTTIADQSDPDKILAGLQSVSEDLRDEEDALKQLIALDEEIGRQALDDKTQQQVSSLLITDRSSLQNVKQLQQTVRAMQIYYTYVIKDNNMVNCYENSIQGDNATIVSRINDCDAVNREFGQWLSSNSEQSNLFDDDIQIKYLRDTIDTWENIKNLYKAIDAEDKATVESIHNKIGDYQTSLSFSRTNANRDMQDQLNIQREN